MTHRLQGVAAIAAACALGVSVACAAPVTAVSPTEATPSPQTSGGVQWLTGGVTLEERDAIREQASDYNLWIWLARTGSGYFLADVRVSVEDAAGRPVLDTVTDGPWLLARLPPGRYTIRTDQSDAVTPVTVGPSGQAVAVLRFPGD